MTSLARKSKNKHLRDDWWEDDKTYQKLLNNDDIPSGETREKNICEMIDGRMVDAIMDAVPSETQTNRNCNANQLQAHQSLS